MDQSDFVSFKKRITSSKKLVCNRFDLSWHLQSVDSPHVMLVWTSETRSHQDHNLESTNRKEGNKTEDRTPNAQTETAPGSLLPQHCVHLSTVTVTTTPCCLQVICGFAWHTGWWVPPRWRPGLTSLSVSQPLAPCQVHSRDLVTALNGWMKKASTVSDCVEQTGY